MRVLLLSTPLSPGWTRNGSTCALVDLGCALSIGGEAKPIVLVRRGTEAPRGCEPVEVGRLGVPAAVIGARPDVIHSIFAPRPSTSLGLLALKRATRARLVQTVASVPRRWTGIRHSMVGDRVVATSRATEAALLDAGVPRARLSRIPMPFAHPGAVDPSRQAPRYGLLYVGDYEFGDALEPTLRAFSEMSLPIGVRPTLVIAAREKTVRAKKARASMRALVARNSVLRDRVRVIGEVESLLPWIAAARCALLPASSTYAKLDHPRALLEAIALGTRIVVGSAPSLAELVTDAALGEAVRDIPSLREAMERALELGSASPGSIVRALAPRSPDVVARAYAALYR